MAINDFVLVIYFKPGELMLYVLCH